MKFWDLAAERAEQVQDAKEVIENLQDPICPGDTVDTDEGGSQLDRVWAILDDQHSKIGDAMAGPKSSFRKRALRGL